MPLLLHVDKTALDAALALPELAGATVSVTVADSTGTVVYQRNSDLRLLPASNEKLFTGAFALYELGPQFRPETRFWKLPNALVVDSAGDPTMSHDDLATAWTQMGVDRSEPVYVRQSYDPEILGDWEMGDLPNAYAAPVSAFSVDQGGFELWNNHGRLELRPQSYGVRLKRGKGPGKPQFAYDPLKRLVTFDGVFPDKVERLDTLGVPDSAEAAALALGSRIVRTDQLPNTQPSYTQLGKPLAETLSICLHRSDNIIAENLLLMAAQHEGPLPADPYPIAAGRLKEFLTRVVGVDSTDISPDDGSGLSRYNLTTTRAIVKLLEWEAGQPTAGTWQDALASAGTGTLRSRLKGITFQGKTGSMSHVASLSGYLRTRTGAKLVVSIIVNNFAVGGDKISVVIDGFVRKLFETVS